MLDSKTIMGALLSIVLYRRWRFEAFMRECKTDGAWPVGALRPFQWP